MDEDPAKNLLHLSYNRYEILTLITEGEFDKREIESQIDASRPTIDRAFRELEDTGILNSEGTTYELTNFGELYCETFTQTADAFGTLASVKEILSRLPRDASIDMQLLEGASVYQAKEHASQEPFMEVINIARQASEISGYSSSLMPYYVDVFHSLIVEEGIPATLVVTEDVVETARENYADKSNEVIQAEHATVYATPKVKTYGLLVADETVAVPIGSERDRLQAVIVNDTGEAMQWAMEYIDRLIEPEQAHVITASQD